jgi:hypothetical protein
LKKNRTSEQKIKNKVMTDGVEVAWWKSLKKKDMLEMATVLAKHALPAWNDFDLHCKSKQELKTLPENALKEIQSALKGNLEHNLCQHYNSFITPVIHIRDGYLKYPYEVRLAFLSVFHILHGMVSTNNIAAAKEAFSSSISKSIDAIKIAGILTTEQISLITNKYYLLTRSI